MNKILVVGIVMVILVIGITIAVIAAAPYIAICCVLGGIGWITITFDEDSPGPPGPPTVP